MDIFGIKKRKATKKLILESQKETIDRNLRLESLRESIDDMIKTICDLETGNASENALYNWKKLKELEDKNAL